MSWFIALLIKLWIAEFIGSLTLITVGSMWMRYFPEPEKEDKVKDDRHPQQTPDSSKLAT